MSYSFIGNTCVSGWVYYYMKLNYNNPFIWHLILDDADFIKVCKNFNHYISQEPTFVDEDLKNGRYLKHPSIDKNYPILKLADVNFHFIHHKHKNEVLKKYLRRLERMGSSSLVPVAWDEEIKDKSLIPEFKSLDDSILVSASTQEEAAKKIIIKLKK